MENRQLQVLLQGINAVNSLQGVKFAYGINKNRKAIERELETLQEAIKASDKYTEYDKKRIELCEKHAVKDDNGKAKMENNEYVITDKDAFDKEIDTLRAKYKDAIDEREAQLKEFSELLKKESDFVPFKIAFEDVPEDITSDAMSKIIDLIDEPVK